MVGGCRRLSVGVMAALAHPPSTAFPTAVLCFVLEKFPEGLPGLPRREWRRISDAEMLTIFSREGKPPLVIQRLPPARCACRTAADDTRGAGRRRTARPRGRPAPARDGASTASRSGARRARVGCCRARVGCCRRTGGVRRGCAKGRALRTSLVVVRDIGAVHRRQPQPVEPGPERVPADGPPAAAQRRVAAVPRPVRRGRPGPGGGAVRVAAAALHRPAALQRAVRHGQGGPAAAHSAGGPPAARAGGAVDAGADARVRCRARPHGCMRTAVHRGGVPPLPLDPPAPQDPPPPLPLFEADSQNLLRRLRCQEDLRFKSLGPLSAGTIGGPWEEGGVPAKPPL